MRTLDVLFPGSRSRLLSLLFSKPTRARYVRELSAASGLALSTVQHELRKLSAMSLVISWSNGYHRFYRANDNHVLVPHLIRVVEIAGQLPVAESRLKKRENAKKIRGNKGRVWRSRSSAPNWGIFSRERK